MEDCSVGNHNLNKKGWNGLQIRLRRCHNQAAETLRGCLKVWVFTNQIQKWEGPGKCKRKHLAKREQGISEGLLCGSHWTPLQLPSHTLWNCSLCWFYLDWASPQGPRVWNQDKIPHCFQKQEKLKKEQHKQTQNHLLFQHLQAYFPFYDPFGKQSFLKRTNIILQSSPQGMAMLPEANHQLWICVTVWSLPRVTRTATHWTHLWVMRWGNSLPETVCCSLSLADPTCFNQHNDDSPPPHAYCAGETLLKCGACLFFFDIARWLSRTSWSLPRGCFSEQPLVVAPVQGNWWKLGAHPWRIPRTIKV